MSTYVSFQENRALFNNSTVKTTFESMITGKTRPELFQNAATFYDEFYPKAFSCLSNSRKIKLLTARAFNGKQKAGENLLTYLFKKYPRTQDNHFIKSNETIDSRRNSPSSEIESDSTRNSPSKTSIDDNFLLQRMDSKGEEIDPSFLRDPNAPKHDNSFKNVLFDRFFFNEMDALTMPIEARESIIPSTSTSAYALERWNSSEDNEDTFSEASFVTRNHKIEDEDTTSVLSQDTELSIEEEQEPQAPTNPKTNPIAAKICRFMHGLFAPKREPKEFELTIPQKA